MARFAPLLVSGYCWHEGFPAQHVWHTLHAKTAMVCMAVAIIINIIIIVIAIIIIACLDQHYATLNALD